MSGKIGLPRVTLCCADTASPELAMRAMACCLDQCDFGDAVLLTDIPIAAPFRVEAIPPLSGRGAYSDFIVKRLHGFVRTDFVLIVQWDGYVVDAGVWRDDFLDHDYVGARWPWIGDGMAVGNGGFSLRSRKLLDILASDTTPWPAGEVEDLHICRALRPQLEAAHGIRFAPAPVADAFSYELIDPIRPSFGFHGLVNLWRHVEDGTMQELATAFSDDIVRSEHFLKLMTNYALLRKFDVLGTLYRRIGGVVEQGRLSQHIDRCLGRTDMTAGLLAMCDSALGAGRLQRPTTVMHHRPP